MTCSTFRRQPVRLWALAVLWAVALAAPAFAQTDPLPSWNAGHAKARVVAFVTAVVEPGGKDYVPPGERIATFDNDGTLWAEQPMYFQILFALDRVKAMAPQHPEWRTQEPFASLLKGDLKAALAGGERAMAEIMMATHAGMTTDAFEQTVKDWMATARHPVTRRPYTEMIYQPMLELLGYLRANGFKTYIVSGGGVEFLRVISEELYGVPPEQVIGSSVKTKYELRNGVLVHHDDAQREFAYDRQSHVGRLDRALDEAGARGWTVVSMKQDWKQVFPSR